jgi:hypothetical protein
MLGWGVGRGVTLCGGGGGQAKVAEADKQSSEAEIFYYESEIFCY